MSRKWYLSWVVCGLALPCFGQEVRIGGPVTGIVFDAPSRSLRQIVGMPGAAQAGPAIVADVDWASVAPNGRRAILVAQGEARVFSSLNGSQDPAGVPISGVVDAPQYSCWSADSSAVVLYSAASRSIQWIRFGAEGAAAEEPVALGDIEGSVTALAGDEASGLAIVAVADSGIFRVTSTEGTVALVPGADASAIALEPGGHTLWVADRASTSLLELPEPGTQSDVRTLLTDPDKLGDISAIGLSSDRKGLYLASRPARRLYLLDRATAVLSDGMELESPVTMLLPLGRPSLMLLGLRAKAGEPLYLLDESSGPGIFFVPVGEGN